MKSNNKSLDMIKEIVKSVDYDVYKSLFVSPEEQDIADEKIQELLDIVSKYKI